MRFNSLMELTRARLLEFVRSPGTIFWVFGFPVLLAVVLGLAFRNQPPEPVRVSVVGERFQEVKNRLRTMKDLDVVDLNERESRTALRSSKIDIEIQLASWRQERPNVVYVYDETRPTSRLARLAAGDAIERAFGRIDGLTVAEEKVTEPGGRYIDFLIPGLIGLNIMGSCMWGIGYAVVDARRRKLLKRFAATPMHRSHFLISFMLSRFLFLFAEVLVLIVFGYLAFKMHIEGSIAAVCVLSIAGTIGFSGLSLLIGARPSRAEVASGWMNFAMMPMWLLSGSFFSYDKFPDWLHPFIQLLPLTALNDGLRLVINDGVSMTAIASQTLVLLVWGIVGFAVSLKIFKWQ